jgi:glucose-6-phosphate 1-dehydrogenase
MTTTARRPAATRDVTDPQSADVFVVFGITGDLAKVMKGSWGPEAAKDLVASHGTWHGLWLPS